LQEIQLLTPANFLKRNLKVQNEQSTFISDRPVV
jgi:hypothetical protein